MRLKSVRVKGLFGLFDHDVELHLDERITIIHAPNGFGKTVLLKLISGFFGGSLVVFRSYEFQTVTFTLDDSRVVVIRQQDFSSRLLDPDGTSRRYVVELITGNKIERWDPDTAKEELVVAPTTLERYVPGLRRVGPRVFLTNSNERIEYSEAIERFWHLVPAAARRGQHIPEWLSEIRSGVRCRLIETQRLMIQRADPPRSADRATSTVLAVESYSDALAMSLNRTLAESATLSQSLDRTFPNRILAKMHRPPEFDEATIRLKLSQLEEKRARLAKVDLLDKSDEGTLLSHEMFDEVALKILGEYVTDTSAKLKVFDTLLDKIELFVDLLNDRFTYKSVHTHRDRGFVFNNYKGDELHVASLSSGEQHELILLYNLIFNNAPDMLLLIDEPEISLHIAWQKKFLIDLRRIIALAPMDVVLATHSPQLISGNIDLTTQLKGPRDARSKH